jgi:hypothetical protein
MSPQQRCDWENLDRLLEDDAKGDYSTLNCGDANRAAFNDRAWYLSRTLYSHDWNDSRTEYYARKTMEVMIRDAPNPRSSQAILDRYGFERLAAPVGNVIDMILRYGWPRGWEFTDEDVTTGGPRVTRRVRRFQLLAYGQTPSYRYIAPSTALRDPVRSDSTLWRGESPAPPASYAPSYAQSLAPLAHQVAMFRRGDSAMVVMAYDARTPELKGGALTCALMLVTDNPLRSFGGIVSGAPDTGVLIAKAPWGPLLMSGEVYAPGKGAVARARYGIWPAAPAGRVTLSDILLFKPYGTLPTSVEDASSHALLDARVMANQKLGVYWESYGTNPGGEQIRISLTVVREGRSGALSRLARALRLSRQAAPVVISIIDRSVLGAYVTPRGLEVDISTLTKGTYIVQLEAEVAGQQAARSERRITVVGP